MGNAITVSDLAAEFTRIAAMPDDTFFADGAKLYMNSYVTDDPTDEEKAKYEALEQLTRDLVGMMDDLLITVRVAAIRPISTHSKSSGMMCIPLIRTASAGCAPLSRRTTIS